MTDRSPAPGSTFVGGWLAQREHADHRSRAGGLAEAAGRYLARRALQRPVIVDLGTGRGSNLRYLAPRLPGPRHWRLLDHDARLLAAIEADDALAVRENDTLETRVFDLADDLAPALDGAHLITASALLDLVSPAWIDRLAGACAAGRAAVLMSLSIDGVVYFNGLSDAEDKTGDRVVRAALALDQRRDKGLGPALGPGAPAYLINALSARGFAVTAMPSPWRLNQTDAVLAEALIDGWREAAARQFPAQAHRLARWAARRGRQLAAGDLALTVGHVDILGLPGPTTQAGRRRSRS